MGEAKLMSTENFGYSGTGGDSKSVTVANCHSSDDFQYKKILFGTEKQSL